MTRLPDSKSWRGGKHTVDVEVSIDEFGDEAILDAVKDRNLEADVLASMTKEQPVDARQAAADIQSLLMTARYVQATAGMLALLRALLPPSIAAAAEAMNARQYSQAICDLDDFIEPPKSASATSLLPARAP